MILESCNITAHLEGGVSIFYRFEGMEVCSGYLDRDVSDWSDKAVMGLIAEFINFREEDLGKMKLEWE